MLPGAAAPSVPTTGRSIGVCARARTRTERSGDAPALRAQRRRDGAVAAAMRHRRSAGQLWAPRPGCSGSAGAAMEGEAIGATGERFAAAGALSALMPLRSAMRSDERLARAHWHRVLGQNGSGCAAERRLRMAVGEQLQCTGSAIAAIAQQWPRAAMGRASGASAAAAMWPHRRCGG
jgi:hypothetical protein